MIGHTVYVQDEGGSEYRMRWYTSHNDVYHLITPADAIASAVQSISNGSVVRINNWQSIKYTSFTPATVGIVRTVTVVFEDAIVQLPLPDYIANLVPDEITPAEINLIIDALSWLIEITPFVGVI